MATSSDHKKPWDLARRAWEVGSTFLKSGDECLVTSIHPDGTVMFTWADDPDNPDILHLFPDNDGDCDEWSDVEIV